MGGLAEHAIRESMRCLVQHDLDGAAKIVEDDKKLDALEIETERRAVQLIALRAPMAADLRDVVAAMKISSVVERIGDLGAEFQNLIKRQGAFSEALGERFSFDAFHNEIVDSVLLADVVQNANVRMAQAGNGSCLALEALPANGVRREVSGEDFYGDGAIEASVARAVDFAHPARAERILNYVWAKAGTWI